MSVAIQAPLSNLQMELLKLYSNNVPDADLTAINLLIINYFAQKVQQNADKIWQENGYSNEIMDEWLTTDFRKKTTL